MRRWPVKKNGWLGALLCACLTAACGHAGNAPASVDEPNVFEWYNPHTGVATIVVETCPDMGRLAEWFFSQGASPLPIVTMVNPDAKARPGDALDAEADIERLSEAIPGLRGIAVFCRMCPFI